MGFADKLRKAKAKYKESQDRRQKAYIANLKVKAARSEEAAKYKKKIYQNKTALEKVKAAHAKERAKRIQRMEDSFNNVTDFLGGSTPKKKTTRRRKTKKRKSRGKGKTITIRI